MVAAEDAIVALVNELHPWKARSPSSFTAAGIIIVFSELHPWKAQSPIDVTDCGISTLTNELQYWNARTPMLVTEAGMETLDTSCLSTSPHCASVPVMLVVPSGKTKCRPSIDGGVADAAAMFKIALQCWLLCFNCCVCEGNGCFFFFSPSFFF